MSTWFPKRYFFKKIPFFYQIVKLGNAKCAFKTTGIETK